MALQKVVVTGLGALTPIGHDVPTYWDNLLKGNSGAGPITYFDTTQFKVQFACALQDFVPENHFDRRNLRRMDRCSQYALVAAEEAVQDAGLQLDALNKDRIGVVWGTGIGGIESFQNEVLAYAAGDGTPRMSPFFITNLIADMAAGHISLKYGLRGPNYCTTSACASAANALIDAYQLIQLGKADMLISGGSEAAITQVGMGGFMALKALSQRNDDPKTASRPFDQDRDGFVMGEGAGALILESYAHAKARGAKIYAEIVGTGLAADAHHMTAPDPTGEGMALAMQQALAEAQLQPSDIDYINAHATSTGLGDIAEVNAIKHCFGEHATQLNISATKSTTGHLLGAAGAVEGIAAILALQHQVVPPTSNHFTLDPQLDANLNYTFNQAQPRTIRTALSNNFGFGGHNCSLLFRKV